MYYPYDGAESPENNPFQYCRIGMIKDILDDDKIEGDKGQYNPNAYFTVQVAWVERGGEDGDFKSKTGIIQLPYSHISRGWGTQYKPSKGDIVVCDFRIGGYPIVVSYLSMDYYNKAKSVSALGYYFRDIKEGEYCTKSKKGGEWYLDDKGSIHLITRDQTKTSDVNFFNGIENISDTIVLDNPQIELVLGKVYGYKDKQDGGKEIDFNNEILSSQGNSLRFQIKDLDNDTVIQIDTQGNVNIIQPSGSKFIVNGSDSAEILGNESLALKSDIQQLRDELNTFITTVYNLHMHPTAVSGSPSIPTVTGSSPSTPQGTTKLLGS